MKLKKNMVERILEDYAKMIKKQRRIRKIMTFLSCLLMILIFVFMVLVINSTVK